ncbi:MAG: dihydrofolate reductase family protein [Acidimicrobiia bacterium]|nr:dihydrofolate reductase family protein [Acidimicrobiia bacterium]
MAGGFTTSSHQAVPCPGAPAPPRTRGRRPAGRLRRRRPAGAAGRPWILVNMVASTDGATTIAGRSGGLGGPADREVFRALRGVADVILVAAGTVRAERYGPPKVTDDVRARRETRGQSPVPRLAVVTREIDLDLGAPVFTESDPPPIVITGGGADRARRTEVARAGIDLVLAGTGVDADLHRAVAAGELWAATAVVRGRTVARRPTRRRRPGRAGFCSDRLAHPRGRRGGPARPRTTTRRSGPTHAPSPARGGRLPLPPVHPSMSTAGAPA